MFEVDSKFLYMRLAIYIYIFTHPRVTAECDYKMLECSNPFPQ